jgi:HEAT repeat protein
MIQRLDQAPQDPLLWHSFERLCTTWQPDHLTALAEATQQFADQGIDVAQRFVEGIIQDLQATDDRPLRQEHAQTDALCTLAKCQADSFAAEASRLLAYANGPLVLDICEALWVIGDPRAEEALLRKLEQPASQGQAAWFERSRIIRALGTCGRTDGATAILAYLRSEPTISTTIPEEAICPLIREGMLHEAQLSEIVRDNSASVQGRITGMVALAIQDAPGHRALFAEIVDQAEDETLRGYAIRMLGLAQDHTCIGKLQRCLQSTQDAFVAAQAAWALARMHARQAVSDIEQALEAFAATEHAADFINALKHLRQPSSLPLLIDPLLRSRFRHGSAEVIEALGAFLPDPQAKEEILRQLEAWGGGRIDVGEQRPPMRALARHDPNLLLTSIKKLYHAGRLDNSAREELTHWIPPLARQDRVEKTALLEIIKLLVSDHYLPVREQMAQQFGRIDATLCRQIYNELRQTPDDWEQACAVYTLGFWESDEREIQSARYAQASLIRYAGDAALEMCVKHRGLQQLVEQYRSANNLTRLSAYLPIKEQGDEQTIWALHEAVHETDLAHTFLRQLAGDVNGRLRSGRRKRADEEQRLLAAAGIVRFN